MATLLVSQTYLREQSLISDNVDFKLLTPIIRIVQTIDIQQLLGTNLYDKILTDVEATSLTGNYKTLVDDYVLPAMVYYIMARAPYSLQYRYVNRGVVKKTGTDSAPISETEFAKVIDEYKNIAQAYGEMMVKYIRYNTNLFPEYSTNNGINEMSPNKTAYDIDFYIESAQKPLTNEQIREIGSGL
jgi:hypothetical protein